MYRAVLCNGIFRNVFQFFEKSVTSQLSSEEWMQIEERAVKRGAAECPICLRSLQVADAVYDVR